MWKLLTRYHAALLHKGAISEDAMRYFEVQEIAHPWVLLLWPMLACGIGSEFLLGPNDVVRIAIAVVFGVPMTLGLTYATGTYLFAALRADLRRKRGSS